MTTAATEPQTWVPELTFGARLALVRHRMGWNVKEAAHACGFPAQSWRGWEIGGHLPRRHVEIALQIASRTGCDYIWLLTGDRQRSTLQYPATDPLAPRILQRTSRTGRTGRPIRAHGYNRLARLVTV